MAEHEEDRFEERFLPEDRRDIRDLIIAQAEARRAEEHEHGRQLRAKAREDRFEKRRTRRISVARANKGRRLRALNEANVRAQGHVAAAGRSLRAALRDATSVSLPRHSDEARQQKRTIRALEDAMRALRQAGVGNFDETNFDIDLDLDVG